MRDRVATDDAARKRRWYAIGLIVDFEAMRECLGASKVEPELLWSLRDRTRQRSDSSTIVPLNTAQRAWIIATFRGNWQSRSYPTVGFVGDESPWDAAEYLTALIRQLGNDISETAIDALRTLCDAPEDSYTAMLREVASEQTRKRVDALYVPPTLETVAAVLHDRPPVSCVDLQGYVLEALEIVGERIRSDDVDSKRGFYDDRGVPHDENRCRDHLIGLLRQEIQTIFLALREVVWLDSFRITARGAGK